MIYVALAIISKDLTLYQAFDGYMDGYAHTLPNNRQRPGIWSDLLDYLAMYADK